MEEYDELTCPSCDGLVAEGAITCPCGAVVDDEAFWQDPMPGATIEERMAMEVTLENEERTECGAPLIF